MDKRDRIIDGVKAEAKESVRRFEVELGKKRIEPSEFRAMLEAHLAEFGLMRLWEWTGWRECKRVMPKLTNDERNERANSSASSDRVLFWEKGEGVHYGYYLKYADGQETWVIEELAKQGWGSESWADVEDITHWSPIAYETPEGAE